MKRISFLLPAALAMLLLGAACGQSTANTNAANTNSAVAQSYDLTYPGQDGKTALELLSQTHTTNATKEGFINAIDGRQAGEHQFWAFYVNGQLASKGAGDTVTKTGDQIGWRLESF